MRVTAPSKRVLLVVTLALVTSTVVLLPAQETPLMRSRTEIVRFDLSVTDRRGSVVTGLKADDVEIVERGQKQELVTFTGGRDDSPQLHLAVLIDSSPGMGGNLQFARSIAIGVVNRSPGAIDYTLVDVADRGRLSRYARADRSTLIDRLKGWKADGSTAFFDAFNAYLTSSHAEHGRHVMVAVTDGENTAGKTPFDDVITAARRSPSTIYGVGLGAARGDRIQLTRIAEESGGTAVFPDSNQTQMDEVAERIATEVGAQYSVGYVSTDVTRDGRWREVSIRLVRPEHRDFRVRTRGGYYAPTR